MPQAAARIRFVKRVRRAARKPVLADQPGIHHNSIGRWTLSCHRGVLSTETSIDSSMAQTSQDNQAAAEAAVWRACLSSDLVTERQQREFRRWLEMRPENRAAWQEVNSLWLGLDSLDETDLIDETAAPFQEDPAGSDSVRDAQIQYSRPGRGRQRFLSQRLAIAVSLLLAVSVVLLDANGWFADYRTAPGQLRTVELSDGSRILLNSDSALSVDFDGSQRRIRLYGGEAFFEVAADSERPFIVESGRGRIRALGTAFNIRNREKNVEVTVYEHAVRISLENGLTFDRLDEGRQLGFDNEEIGAPSAADLTRVASWRDRQMIFQDRPLVEVVRELEHYHRGLILVVGNRIEKLPVTGVFDTTQTDIVLKTIEQSLPVRIRKITDRLVLISAD